MIKFLIGFLLNLIFGSLKSIILKHVNDLEASVLLDKDKREAAFNSIKTDMIAEGTVFRDSLINLGIELAVTYLKKRA